MKRDDIIIRELTHDELTQRKPFSHFGWEGAGTFSLQTISDGYWRSAKILLKEMIKEQKNFIVVDTLIYPMFFNYRHSIELYLKSLFFNYGEQTEQARLEYLNIGHNLYDLWTKLRQFLNKGKKHVGCSVDFDAVEHYIRSIHDYDQDSMMMRYPIKKDLSTNKEHEFHFDYINFSERMNELCDALRLLDYELSGQMNEDATFDELNTYINIIDKYKAEIGNFIKLLKTEKQEEDIEDYSAHDVITDIFDGKSSPIIAFLDECEPDLLILLDNLFYAGREINTEMVRLSISEVIRQREFVKLCYNLMSQSNLYFGQIPKEYQINIWCKKASALLDNISTALSIIYLKPID